MDKTYIAFWLGFVFLAVFIVRMKKNPTTNQPPNNMAGKNKNTNPKHQNTAIEY